MESLTESSVKEKTKLQIERVSIGKSESEKVSGWLGQLQKSLKGYLSLTKSDLLNFLIREHKAELSPKEMSQIRGDHYDPIRHISWIAQELKTALAKNDMTMVATLQEEIKGVELSVISHANDVVVAIENGEVPPPSPLKPKRKRLPKSENVSLSMGAPISASMADLQENILEG